MVAIDVLGLNDTSTIAGQGRKRNRNKREETDEIKSFPSTLTCYKDSKPCPTVSQYQLDALVM